LAAQAGVRYSLENPHTYIESNIVGFINILEGCRKSGIKNLSFASSSSVYGANKKMPFKEIDKTDHQISFYAATKKSNELIAHAYSHLFKIPTTGLRFFTVYGPWGRPDMALFLFTKAILEGKPINVYNNGDMMRDFTYVDDIVEGVFRVINKPAKPDRSSETSAPYKVYNIGNGSPVQLLDFIKATEKAIGIEAKKNFMPMQPGDVQKTFADVENLKKDFGYKPKTTVSKGVEKFIDWYRKYYNV